ncbi:uncharacterized protein LOC118598233 [Oryzias melastigma]|uniref:uncharacterized protein LOC118598233 n=1 Tax=Oryzias melastigma TaxID=30732 RepID=UPI00168D50DB|nr:uncharacterized protein LOC118598233 [Oryzias melastigma]
MRSDGDLLSVYIGDSVTLPCSFASSSKHLSWYQQRVGKQPQIISSIYKRSNSNSFYKPFNNRRFSVHTGGELYSLSISDVQNSDSAMYYCGHTSITITEFDRGTFLMMNVWLSDSSCRSLIQEPDWDSTLNCTLLTGTSEEEGRVYWFLQESGGFSWGSVDMQSGSSSESGSAHHSCDFTSPQRSASDGGTSLCAVAACGHILRLHAGEKQSAPPSVLMLCAAAALTVSAIFNILFICVFCMKCRRKHPEGSQHQSEVTADSQNQDSPAVQYVALDFKLRRQTSRIRRSTEESVYSAVRGSH